MNHTTSTQAADARDANAKPATDRGVKSRTTTAPSAPALGFAEYCTMQR